MVLLLGATIETTLMRGCGGATVSARRTEQNSRRVRGPKVLPILSVRHLSHQAAPSVDVPHPDALQLKSILSSRVLDLSMHESLCRTVEINIHASYLSDLTYPSLPYSSTISGSN